MKLFKIRTLRIILWVTIPLQYLLRIFVIKRAADVLFFFDRYQMGGAQKVYLDILRIPLNTYRCVFMTRKSEDDHFKQALSGVDIYRWCEHPIGRILIIHWLAAKYRNPNLIVVGSNSTFFFDLLPFLKYKKAIELLHNYSPCGMQDFGRINKQYLTHRVFVDKHTMQQSSDDLSGSTVEHILAEPYVRLMNPFYFHRHQPVKVLFAGRNAQQKRIMLIEKIFAWISNNTNIEFHFAGIYPEDLQTSFAKKFAHVHGKVGDRELQNSYSEFDILILTSDYEGFPMVIKEAMLAGCVPMVTRLPGIEASLSEDVALYLPVDERACIDTAVGYLQLANNNPTWLEQRRINAGLYALEHYYHSAADRFDEVWGKYLLSK